MNKKEALLKILHDMVDRVSCAGKGVPKDWYEPCFKEILDALDDAYEAGFESALEPQKISYIICDTPKNLEDGNDT